MPPPNTREGTKPYSVASSVMERILAVHSVMWCLSRGAEHSLHLHLSLDSWNLASLQNLQWKPCTAILFLTCRSWWLVSVNFRLVITSVM